MKNWLSKAALPFCVSLILTSFPLACGSLEAKELKVRKPKKLLLRRPIDIFLTYDDHKDKDINKETTEEEKTSSSYSEDEEVTSSLLSSDKLPFLTTKQIQQLSLESLSDLEDQEALSAKILSALSHEQIQTLPRKLLARVINRLSAEQIKTLKGEQVSSLDPKLARHILTSLSRYQLKFLSRVQLASLSGVEIRQIFDALEEDQLSCLEARQIKAIPKYRLAAKVNSLSEKQLQVLTNDQLEAMIDTHRLSEVQVAHLLPEQIQAVTDYSFLDLFPYLSRNQLALVKASQISLLLNSSHAFTNKVSAFSIRELVQLDPKDFALVFNALSRAQKKVLFDDHLVKEEHLLAFSYDQVESIPVDDLLQLSQNQLDLVIAKLNTQQLESLLTHNLNGLIALDYFTPERIAKLSSQTIQRLHPANFVDLFPYFTPEQVSLASSAQLSMLKEEEFQVLPLDRFQVLTATQLASLSDEQVQALRLDQIQSLDATRLASILLKLNAEQLNYLAADNLEAILLHLPPQSLKEKIESETLKDFDLTLFTKLSFDQKQALLGAHLSDLSQDILQALKAKDATLFTQDALSQLSLESIHSFDPELRALILPQLPLEKLIGLDHSILLGMLPKLPPESFAGVFPLVVDQISQDLLRQLKADQVHELSAFQLEQLDHAELIVLLAKLPESFIANNLQETTLAFLQEKEFESLIPGCKQLLIKYHFDELPVALIKTLSAKEAHLFSADQVALIEPRKFQILQAELQQALAPFLSLDQLLSMRDAQVDELVPYLSDKLLPQLLLQVVDRLSPENLSKVAPNSLMQIDEQLIEKLDQEQLKALSAKQVASFSVTSLMTQSNHLSAEQLGELSAQKIAALPPGFFKQRPYLLKGISGKQLALLDAPYLEALGKNLVCMLILEDPKSRVLVPRISHEMLQQFSVQELSEIFDSLTLEQLNSIGQERFLSLQSHLAKLDKNVVHKLSLETLKSLTIPTLLSILSKLSPEQLKVLMPKFMPYKQQLLTSLQHEHLEDLGDHFLSALSLADFNTLNYQQLLALSEDFFAKLSWPTLRQFLRVQKDHDQRLAISYEALVAKLPLYEIENLSLDDFNAVFPYFSNEHIKHASPLQLEELSGGSLAKLPPDLFATLSPTFYDALSLHQIQDLAGAQIKKIPADLFAGMNNFVLALSENQVRALTPQQIEKLPFSCLVQQLPFLLASQVSHISLASLNKMTQQDIQSMSSRQISALSYEQVEGLSPSILSLFSKEQLEALNYIPSSSTFLHLYSPELNKASKLASDQSEVSNFDITQDKLLIDPQAHAKDPILLRSGKGLGTKNQHFRGNGGFANPFRTEKVSPSSDSSKQSSFLDSIEALHHYSPLAKYSPDLEQIYLNSTLF